MTYLAILENNRFQFLLPVLFLVTGFCVSQNTHIPTVERLVNESKYDSARIVLNTIKPLEMGNFDKGRYHFYSGVVYKKNDLHGKAFEDLLEARNYFRISDSLSSLADTNYEIYDLTLHQKGLRVDATPYLNEFISYAQSKKDPLLLARAYLKIGGIHNQNDSLNQTIYYYRKAIKELKKIDNVNGVARLEMNIGVAHNEIGKNPDSALYYFNKSLRTFEKLEDREMASINFNNTAEAYIEKEDYSTAIEFYHKAMSFPLREYDSKTRVIYYGNVVRAYQKTNDFRNAYLYLKKLDKLKDSINETAQNININEIIEQYDNEKLRTDNLESEVKRRRNQNIAIGLGGGLLAVSIFGFLIYKNTKRKQHIAEQEKELEVQRTEKVLAEQELTSIQAMIAGQEKERELVAEDLHHGVAGTINAARMQFEHIAKNKDQATEMTELFKKTEALLQQAHEEVRSMAHLKNTGVIATKGLLPAIQNLAKNASSTQGLKVDVQDFGLTERIDNSLEIRIFRTIQELINNVIKHANATEATISLTRHEGSLSIIVEDNGQGFDITHLSEKEGMGLYSMEKHIEQIDGTLHIDSSPGNGTSVLIDIPL